MYTADLADARKRHGQDLAELVRVRNNDLAMARQVHRMAQATALIDYRQGLAAERQSRLGVYALFEETVAAEYQAQLADHQVEYLESLRPKFLLHEQAVSGATMVESFDVNQAEKDRGDTLATAERDRTVKRADELQALQTASNSADFTRAQGNAEVWKTQDVSRADAEKLYANDLAAAEETRSIAQTEAFWQWEVGKKEVNRDFINSSDQAARAAAMTVKEEIYRDDLADATHVYAYGSIDAQDMAAAEKGLSIGYGNAQADRAKEEDVALATAQASESNALADYQSRLVVQRTILDDDLAGVSMVWVNTMAPAKATLHTHPQDSAAQSQYNATAASADATRYTNSRAKAVLYAGRVGDDQITRAQDLGDALIVAATALGQAGLDYTNRLNTADNVYQTAANIAEGFRDLAANDADLAYEESSADAKHGKLVAVHSARLIYQGQQGISSVIHAGSVALAEGTFQIAVANQISGRTDIWAAALATAAAGLKGAKAAAISTWTSLVAPAFTLFASANAQADATRNSAQAANAAVRDELEDAYSAEYDIDVQELFQTNRYQTRVRQREFDAGQATRENVRKTAFSQADKTYAVSYATDAKLYAVAIASAEKTFQVGPGPARIGRQSG